MEPQADAVRAPAPAIPEAVVVAGAGAPTSIPPNVLQNGNGQLTLEDLREATARRFAVPDGVQTAADVAAEAENGTQAAPTVAQPREPEPPDLLEAAELLRQEVANLQLSLEVDGVATAREQREALLHAARRLPAAAVAPPRRAAAGGRRRVDGRRQVDPGELDRPARGHALRRPAPHHPLAGARAPPLRLGCLPVPAGAAGSRPGDQRGNPSPPSRSTSTHRASPRYGWCRTRASRPAWRSSMRPTSIPWSRRTATWPSSCSPPPTCGSS